MGQEPVVLDLYSPVGKQPEQFGVELLPIEPDDDLALSAKYRVSDGLGERASLVAAARTKVGS